MESEIGDEVAIVIQNKGIAGVGGDNVAVFSPVDEIVSCVRRCVHGAGRACGESASATNGAAIGRVGRHSDGVLRGLAGHLECRDVWLTLLAGDHNHDFTRGHKSDRHIDGAIGRYQSHADDFIVLGNSDV